MASHEIHIPRRNQRFWQEHTDQWRDSGLSKIAYCLQHNLKPASFYHWSKKLEHARSYQQPLADTRPSFVPVQLV